MNKDRELRRFETLILRMRKRVVDLHNYNRVMKVLNSITDEKSFEGVLEVLSEGFKIDSSSLMVLREKRLETIAFYGEHPNMHYIAGKEALFFASTALTNGKAQTMKTETGVLLSLPITKSIGNVFGVLNLYKYSDLTDKIFTEKDQRLFSDIASQIGVSLERVIFC